jgi:cytochrome c oxidase subunit 2
MPPGMIGRDLATAARRAALGAAALAAAPAAALAGQGFPPEAGTRGRAVEDLFWLATILGAIAFAAVVAVLVWCVVAYRARPGRRAAYLPGDSRKARLATGIFAVAVFVGLDVVLAVRDDHAWETMYGDLAAMDASNAEEVQCLAKQFEWLFRYPGRDGRFGTGDDLYARTLVIPEDRPTVVRLRSIDVIHSFFLPHWRTKQDAVPGMTTSLAIHPKPGSAGEYEIACAELCGMGHYTMRGVVQVRARPAFDAWVAEREGEIAEYGTGATPDEAGFWAQYDARGGREGR